MATPTLVYCAGGNRRFAEAALDAGFAYGARLPDTVYFPLWFADQDFKKPNRSAYMAGLAEHHPVQATVLDLEREEQFDEVLSWAEEAAQYVERLVIVPKVFGIIERLPRRVGAAEVILGYSVPTKYAGTEVPAWEFRGWPVHLLGGSPHAQMRMVHYFNVVSADGNMMQKMALKWCNVWVNGTAREANNRWWPRLENLGDGHWGEEGAPYEAFRRSCLNIQDAWRALCS